MTTSHSPEGFFVYASSYKRAAEALMEQRTSELMVPTIYLLSHSLELALKSFLLFKGLGAEDLGRKPFCHDVMHCLTEAEANGLFGSTSLSASERATVASASVMFEKKELNYFYEKAAVLPSMDTLQAALHAVLSAVFDRISHPYFQAMRP